uniref:Putative secreted protein n=1 Tax=Anopheles marajoara TaxID=58244 RepID=A0A2M4C4N5_9DIPT
MGYIFKLTVLLTALIQSLVVSQTSLAYCPDATRPHASRCDQYLRCDNLANGDHVWTTVQCHKGLVYRQYIGTCVVPGELKIHTQSISNGSELSIYYA